MIESLPHAGFGCGLPGFPSRRGVASAATRESNTRARTRRDKSRPGRAESAMGRSPPIILLHGGIRREPPLGRARRGSVDGAIRQCRIPSPGRKVTLPAGGSDGFRHLSVGLAVGLAVDSDGVGTAFEGTGLAVGPTRTRITLMLFPGDPALRADQVRAKAMSRSARTIRGFALTQSPGLPPS